MDSRKLSVVHSYGIKSGVNPIEIPVSRNSKILGVVTDPVTHLPVISIAEDVEELAHKETKVRTFHLRPDGTPFEDQHRFHHVGSVFAMFFNYRLEMVHIFEERLPDKIEEGSVLDYGGTAYLAAGYDKKNYLYGYMWGRQLTINGKSEPGYVYVAVDGEQHRVPDFILSKIKPEGWDGPAKPTAIRMPEDRSKPNFV